VNKRKISDNYARHTRDAKAIFSIEIEYDSHTHRGHLIGN
jgi:hypothetical protein